MKDGIHPDYKKTVIKCVCGNEIETGSVVDDITVEICSNCHPFYTGQQKILDSEGRVERFNVTAISNSLLRFYNKKDPAYGSFLLTRLALSR